VAECGGPRDLRYAEAWEGVGAIPLPLAVARALADPTLYDWLAHGLARHAAGLVAAGWGATVAEALAWFDPLQAGAWVVPEGRYTLAGPCHPPLPAEFLGSPLTEARYEAGALVGTVHVTRAMTVPLTLPGPRALGAFAMAAVPAV
jgi:hypothetical protein